MIHVHGIGNYHHRMSVKEANWMLLQISKCAQRPNIWHAYYSGVTEKRTCTELTPNNERSIYIFCMIFTDKTTKGILCC